MARMTGYECILESKGITTHDVKQTIATFPRVNSSAGFYIQNSYKELVTSGIGENVAKLCRAMFGNVIVNDDVYAYIAAQTYSVAHVFQLASDKALADANDAGATFDNVHDIQNNGQLIARPLVDVNGQTVYARLTSTGKLYRTRYTFARLFNVFVVPALLSVVYDQMNTGNVDIYLKPVKSVSAGIRSN